MASEYLKWKYRDVQPDVPRELTPKERRANWWDYHIWHVILAVVLLLVLANLAFNAWNGRRNAPVYQAAYVSSHPLPEETASALEAALTELAGGRRVGLNQYLTAGAGAGSEAALYASASNVKLMADLDGCDSFLFLLEDPETFQSNYQVLRNLDGTLPEGGGGKAFCLPWADCPVLASLPLGTYSETLMGQEITGDGQALFSSLYVARRGFWTEKTCKDPEGCDALWEALTKGAAS